MLSQAGTPHCPRGVGALQVSSEALAVRCGTARHRPWQQQVKLVKQGTCTAVQFHHGCLRPQTPTLAPRPRLCPEHTVCHSTLKPDNQEPEAASQPDQPQPVLDVHAAHEAKLPYGSGSGKVTTNSSISVSWEDTQLSLLMYKKKSETAAATGSRTLPSAATVGVQLEASTLLIHQTAAGPSKPSLVVSMMGMPGDDNPSEDDSTSSNSSVSDNHPNSVFKYDGSSMMDVNRLATLFKLPAPAAADLARRLQSPRLKNSAWRQHMQALAAAETSDKLVRLLQSVPRRQLEMARYEAGLGPPPEQPPPTELPLGSRIGDKDGMLECNCKLPVSRWRAKKQGKNKGKWYYRCRDFDFRNCFYVFEQDMLNFPNAPKVMDAAKKAAPVWLGPDRKSWENKLERTTEQRTKRYEALLDEQLVAELPAMAEAGAWNESNLFLWFKLVLPGFDADCWVSSNKRYKLFPVPGKPWQPGQVPPWEPPYDFIYTDSQGVLGVAGATYFIDAKCTRGVAVMSGRKRKVRQTTKRLRSILVQPNEWDKAAELHDSPDLDSYVIIDVDRVQEGFDPRLVAVLVDPFGMSKVGMLSAEVKGDKTGRIVLLKDYWGLVQPDVFDTAQE